MRNKLIGLTLGAILLASSGAEARKTYQSTMPPVAISTDSLKRHTQILSSDAYEGRSPATPAEEKTVHYIADEFAKLGLQPGNSGSWFQDVPMVEITTDPSANLTFMGSPQNNRALKLAYGKDVVLWSKRAQERISVNASDVVFVGYGINAPELGWNDYAGVDVKGKTVLILINDPDWQQKSGPFEGRAMTYYGRWTYKFEEAARQGAAAAIIIHDDEPAAYPWGTVTSSWTGPQLDMDRADRGMNRVAAEGWITKDAATRLLRLTGLELAKLTAAASQRGFKAVPLPSTTANISLSNSIRRSNSKNVVALLPGTKQPNEYILYSAHWDHLGQCPADESGDDICNGALDNASGVAGLLALAESYKAAGAPKRSVIFLAVTGEESGLLGSQYYAENPIYPLAQTVAGINMDVLNVVGRTADIVVIGAGKSELEDQLKQAAAAQGRIIAPEPTPERGYFYRSDHFSMAKLGVPMLYFKSGVDVRGKGTAWGRAKADDYTARCYHKPCDEYDPNWDWSGAVEDLSLSYRIGRELADSDAWPNWYPTAEFRTARDKSRSSR